MHTKHSHFVVMQKSRSVTWRCATTDGS